MASAIGVARGFARHLATIDPASEVPSTDLLPATRPRVAPHIYADAEIAALMAAARTLRPRLRGVHHETLIGLPAVTGMRPGEAVALDRAAVDLRPGTVHVRSGNQKKQREVPLHQSTISALGEYARLRDTRFPEPSTPAFFISARRRRMGREKFNRTFTELIEATDLQGRGGRRRPRPHDLRHTMAVRPRHHRRRGHRRLDSTTGT